VICFVLNKLVLLLLRIYALLSGKIVRICLFALLFLYHVLSPLFSFNTLRVFSSHILMLVWACLDPKLRSYLTYDVLRHLAGLNSHCEFPSPSKNPSLDTSHISTLTQQEPQQLDERSQRLVLWISIIKIGTHLGSFALLPSKSIRLTNWTSPHFDFRLCPSNETHWESNIFCYQFSLDNLHKRKWWWYSSLVFREFEAVFHYQ
jgi:hypothetical protein